MKKAFFHLPGLFEFTDFYRAFLPLFYEHRAYFYDWCDIGSVYGAPSDCLWGGGRVGFGQEDGGGLLEMLDSYGISARLTFSNSLLERCHLSDRKCNGCCALLEKKSTENGVIVHSELLADYLQRMYPGLYLVSSTTKVLTDFEDCLRELDRPCFRYVVPDFRLNKELKKWSVLPPWQKDKVEFLCNECCDFGCTERKACYENVSRKVLGKDVPDHVCPHGEAGGYRFSKAMENPGFISLDDILSVYMPMGFSQFKIEGRSLGSAVLLEFLLYYMTKPAYQLHVREALYLDSALDLF